MISTLFFRFKIATLSTILLIIPSITFADIVLNPGVSLAILDQIDEIEDEDLQNMLRSAIWPGYGERFMNLEREDADLTVFEKNYKSQPLTWSQKIDNVRYLLDNAEDLSTLNIDSLEYKDIVFGEAVIPVLDKRVKNILNTIFLEKEFQLLEKQKQEEIVSLRKTDQGNLGEKLQIIEDKYAARKASLIQAENAYKKAKIDFLKLENQKKFKRITQEEYQQKTLEVISTFENFFEIGSENPVFEKSTVKQLASSIYDKTIQIAKPKTHPINKPVNRESDRKKYYGAISILLMLMALGFGALGFNQIRKNRKKSNF